MYVGLNVVMFTNTNHTILYKLCQNQMQLLCMALTNLTNIVAPCKHIYVFPEHIHLFDKMYSLFLNKLARDA